MVNEYGSTLDRNGYAEQVVLCYPGVCQYCGKEGIPLQRHEVFHGAYREKSKRLGAWVLLCHECHEELHQHDASIDWELKRWMQSNIMAKYGWTVERFRAEFGRNYE